ncbi:SRPBCC family protein [Flavobacteriaceae bacterium TP-CH-4]|uniref:SRPBCC family protein n=1 Tax=Pelagihabitans pacificus TaxID=2696054 RepID=A0A967ATT4_9FLAO|nr:SRPBCC family protein [Pelagihabitans pacificus]NHF60254.1 SRPBCC family protein [Pelagihabitans pacificus]
MQLYQLNARQYLPMTKQAAWEFLSDPKNLKVITPEHMGFHILAGADRPMFEGQIIQYKVSPFPGFKTKWVSEITSVKEGEYFVDKQLFGPYSLWHHKHFIREITGGVVMEDVIDYKIPLGILGRIAHPIIVKKQLKQIFSFREQKLRDLFGSLEGKETFLEIKAI